MYFERVSPNQYGEKELKIYSKLTYKIQNLRWELDWLYPDDKKKLTWRKPYVLKTSKKIVSVVHQQIFKFETNKKINTTYNRVLCDQIRSSLGPTVIIIWIFKFNFLYQATRKQQQQQPIQCSTKIFFDLIEKNQNTRKVSYANFRGVIIHRI